MDPQVSGSFIPKKSLAPEARAKGSVYGFFVLVSLFLCVSSLVAAGASFAYIRYLNSALATKSHFLALAQASYDPGSIQDLIRLDTRLNQAKSLLNKHIAPSAIFDFLSQETLEKVQFKGFSFDFKDETAAIIKLDGQADTFSSLALQSDRFGGSKVLKNVIFSSIVVDSETKKVTFSVSATLDPSLISFLKNSNQDSNTASTTSS
jgi:hypothetical protein